MVTAHLVVAASEDAERQGVFTLDGFPFWIVYLAAFCLVMVRAGATYWLGRGVARGTVRTRAAELLTGDRATRVIDRIHRWGPPAVTFSFFTVGIQTVVNLAAGYLRMPFGRYLVALTFGSLIWAAIWTTVGTAVVWGAVLLFLEQPAVLAALAVLAAGLTVWLLLRRRSRHRTAAPQPDEV
ncbi:DedA family protein [Isoptericola sediminis]|uniref:VTT domain-containing protein n=1 Tax=Isoptericola sediminis TaxID=2733572 RepID=A0A849K660_9MICO|nr:VTT domain-containing protein [Isoptericola sediminis]NNU28421.1 hypothetical protein [Isoptericola sediminis]